MRESVTENLKKYFIWEREKGGLGGGDFFVAFGAKLFLAGVRDPDWDWREDISIEGR